MRRSAIHSPNGTDLRDSSATRESRVHESIGPDMIRTYDEAMQRIPLPRTLVLYDGNCGFCSASMKRWQAAGKGRLDFAPSQSGRGESHGFPSNEPLGSLCLIEESGDVHTGAAAVYRLMSLCGNPIGKVAWAMHQKFGIFHAISNWGYRQVAKRRNALAKLSCRVK